MTRNFQISENQLQQSLKSHFFLTKWIFLFRFYNLIFIAYNTEFTLTKFDTLNA